ncbi:MAG TPA: hypothetical protein VJ583_11480 [Nitrososphaeraceae archaeon]|nr:hypothetical protein [Nitrososphaeraceae archaeon]
MMKKVALLLLLVIAIPIINSEIYGHTFTTDESVIFLNLVDKLKAHAKLIEQFILEDDYESAFQHANLLKQLYSKEINHEIEEKNKRIANEISSIINTFSSLQTNNMTQSQITNTRNNLDAVLDESISVRISEDVLNNSTIQALRLATLVNDIDVNYANSFSRQPYNMSTTNISQHDQNSSSYVAKDIQNQTSYQTAQGLLEPVSELFENIKSEKEISNPDKVTKLKEGFDNLTAIIEMKNPYNEVAKVIHGIIQPSLQELYSLKINIE